MCMAILCQDLLVLVDNVANKQKGKLELVDVVRLSAMGNARVEWGNVVVFEAYNNVSHHSRFSDLRVLLCPDAFRLNRSRIIFERTTNRLLSVGLMLSTSQKDHRIVKLLLIRAYT